MLLIGLQKIFVIKRVKITAPRICGLTVLRSLILAVLAAKKLMEYFTKSDELYDKWKDYDNSFNSWISKRRRSIAITTTI